MTAKAKAKPAAKKPKKKAGYTPPATRTGYLDGRGRIAIPATFDDGYRFRDQRALVVTGGAYAWIDPRGKPVLAPLGLEDGGGFASGLAPARLGGAWGYLDLTGAWAIEPRFADADPFVGPLGQVVDGTARRYINRAGQLFRIPTEPLAFACGRAPVEQPDGKWGYLDETGALVIAAAFDDARAFTDDHAVVEIRGRTGLIDRTGALVIEARHDNLRALRDGLAPILVDGRWGYVDARGAIAIAAAYANAKSFADGLAPVQVGARWGFVDRAGKLAIPARFDDAEPFSDGRARVRVGEQYGATTGYIDRSGKLVVPAKLIEAEAFRDGRAIVERGHAKHAVIDLAGKDIGGVFESIERRDDGMFLVRANGGDAGLMDRDGKLVVAPAWTRLNATVGDLILVQTGDDKHGAVDRRSGKLVIEARFDELSRFSATLLRFNLGRVTVKDQRVGGLWGLVDLTGQIVVPESYVMLGPLDDDSDRAVADVAI